MVFDKLQAKLETPIKNASVLAVIALIVAGLALVVAVGGRK